MTLLSKALLKTTPVTALALSCGFSMLAYAHSGATGIVKERMDFFTQNKENLKAIMMALRFSLFCVKKSIRSLTMPVAPLCA